MNKTPFFKIFFYFVVLANGHSVIRQREIMASYKKTDAVFFVLGRKNKYEVIKSLYRKQGSQ